MSSPRPAPPPGPVRPLRRGRWRRVREIVTVLARHGFWPFLERAHLLHYVPKLLRPKPAEPDGPDALPRRLAGAFQELGPVFVKFGQILSTRPDLLPDDFIAAFEGLQDRVAPEAPEVTRATLERALGLAPERAFAAFDPAPLACGSIAQAHRARLADGADVVVKVRRAGAEDAAREDLALLAWLAGLAERHLPALEPLQPRQLAREFEGAFARELDFTAEAAAAATFAELSRADPGLAVPRVHWPYVRREVLVLAHAPGAKLSDPAWADHPGGRRDGRRVAATLAHSFMRQYFTTGFFHADPHPGNIFVVSDRQVALVDFGQMGRVPDDMRRQMALILAALAKGDPDFAAEIVADLGHAPSSGATTRFREEFDDFVHRYFGMPAERMDFGSVLTGALAIARRHGLCLPRELVLLAKSLITLAGTVRRIDPGFRFNEAVAPYAREALSPKTFAKGLPRRWGRQAYRLLRLAEGAPATIQEVLDKTRRGQLRIVFQHKGLEARFAQAERAINRLAIGLIVAGITIGSAIVLAGGARDELGHLPEGMLGRSIPITVAIAGLGLTAAIAIGFWVMWGVLRTPRRNAPPPHGEEEEDWTA